MIAKIWKGTNYGKLNFKSLENSLVRSFQEKLNDLAHVPILLITMNETKKEFKRLKKVHH